MASISRKSFAIIVGMILTLCMGCVPKATDNSLAQNTGEAGSTVPRSHLPYYPNTAGNIVAPAGEPGWKSRRFSSHHQRHGKLIQRGARMSINSLSI